MTLPDALFPVLLKAVTIAVDERARHLDATARERDETTAGRHRVRELRDDLKQLREVQALLLAMVIR